MYIPPKFVMPEKEVIEFLISNPFGILTSSVGSEIKATHIPFELKENAKGFSLLGHIAAANPHADFLDTNNEHLAIFLGPHSYVSASWYKNINVSTWNYQSVHVYGNLRIMNSDELTIVLSEMMKKYESGRENAVLLERVPSKMHSAYLKEIIGFEFIPTRIEAKSKLSQNRNKSDFESVTTNLEKEDNPMAKEVAKRMRSIKKGKD